MAHLAPLDAGHAASYCVCGGIGSPHWRLFGPSTVTIAVELILRILFRDPAALRGPIRIFSPDLPKALPLPMRLVLIVFICHDLQ